MMPNLMPLSVSHSYSLHAPQTFPVLLLPSQSAALYISFINDRGSTWGDLAAGAAGALLTLNIWGTDPFGAQVLDGGETSQRKIEQNSMLGLIFRNCLLLLIVISHSLNLH